MGNQTHSQEDLEVWNKLKGNIHNCSKEDVTSFRKYPYVVMNLDFIKDANLLEKNRCWE